jgi:WD40 repeat protein
MGKCVCVRLLTGHESAVRGLCFTPDGEYLVVGCEDGSIHLWDVQKARRLHILREHSSRINSLQFSLDGARLVSSSIDGTLCIWDLLGLATDKRPLTKMAIGHSALSEAIITPDTVVHALAVFQG